ncbi:MAG: hypothetical protein ABIP06_14850 [Pyrinomonadaceae bacterium]
MKNVNFTVGQIRPIECYKEGWELIKSDYWLLFAITLVGALIGGFSIYILLGAMLCGIFICYLQKIDTGTVSFDNLWKGFSYFGPALIVMIVFIFPSLVIYGIIYAPILMAMVMGSKLSQDEFAGMMIGAAAVDLVLLTVVVCFHTLLMFSFPLIVDRNLSAFQAMKLSAKAVWKNLGGVIGMIGVYMVLCFLGVMACGIGLYFMMPIIFAGFLVAFRKVFPAQKSVNFNPPPNAYSGL